MSKKTVVIGASDNPERYAFLATLRLQKHKHPVVPVGLRDGEINGIKILTGLPLIENVDTVTLYVGPKHQPYWIDYILSLKPNRIIFNPGTENSEFQKKASNKNIEIIEGCTLVMLASNTY